MNKLAACDMTVNKISFPLHGDEKLQLRFLNRIKFQARKAEYLLNLWTQGIKGWELKPSK